jgi:hypothetical protein
MRGHIILTQSNACSDPFYPASWHMFTVLPHAEKARAQGACLSSDNAERWR